MREVKNVPKLRFKQDNGSDFPQWEMKRLGDIGEIRTGKTPNTSDQNLWMGSIPFITPTDISNNVKYQNYTKRKLALTSTNDLLPKGAILYTCIASIGKMAIATEPSITNQQINSIIVARNYSSEYIYYALLNITPKIKSTQANTTLPIINKTEFSKFNVNLPSLPEQTKIANFLTAVDAKIANLSEEKSLLENYKKGVMQKIFSQELRFKQDDGSDFPQWEMKRLGDIGQIVSGLTYSPENIDENGILVLRSSNVKDRRIVLEDNVFVRIEDEKYNAVQENDILICVRNGSTRLIGKNAIIGKEYVGLAFGAFMTIYRSSYNQFLFHYFDIDAYKREVHKNLGATINSINGSDLKKFSIPFPSLTEQTKIANFLTSIDEKIAAVVEALESTKQFKKGLLQQLFV